MTTSACSPYPKLDAAGQAGVATPAAGPSSSRPRAPNVDAAKKFVKWLWVDNTDFQEDWNLNYGFHIPPRKSLAAKATKLQSGTAAEVVKLNQDFGVVDRPAWTPKMGTGLTDLLTNVIRKGADPAGEITKLDKTVNTELARLFG